MSRAREDVRESALAREEIGKNPGDFPRIGLELAQNWPIFRTAREEIGKNPGHFRALAQRIFGILGAREIFLGPAIFARAPFIWDPRAHDVFTFFAGNRPKSLRNSTVSFPNRKIPSVRDLEGPDFGAILGRFGPILADFGRFHGPLGHY